MTDRPEDQMGITHRQLDHWVRQGYLAPVVAAPGTGNSREWLPIEIEIGRRMARLVAAGFVPERAAVIARFNWPAAEIAPGIRIEVSP
jgi:hypothetical protein